MQIIENYNSSVGKYGKELTEEMEINGINPKYYLSAGRFHIEIGTPINILSKLFKQWEIYVKKNDKSIDVNNLSFNEFRDILNEYKRKFGIPNKIYDDGKVSIGKITSYKDIARFPIKNEWCISKPNQFQQYIDNGYKPYIVDNGISGADADIVRYVMMMISKNGVIDYWDLSNSLLRGSGLREFENTLTDEAKLYIQKLSKITKNKNENIDMKSKNVIRINESQLKQMISENVKKVLKEKIGKDLEDIYTKNLRRYDKLDGPGGDYRMEKYNDMSDRLSKNGVDGGEKLYKLTKNNPIFKKWYDKNVKHGDNLDSWDAFDEYKNSIEWDIIDNADDSNAQLENMNIYDQGDGIWYGRYDMSKDPDYNGENARKEKQQLKRSLKAADKRPLHRKGSANRDIMGLK